MIAILGKGFVPCLTSSNNQNLQLLSFQKIYTLLGFYETCDSEAATMRGCHLGYTDTVLWKRVSTKFLAFRGFSKKFRLKRYFDEISPHFHDTYCFDLRDFSNDNSPCSMIHPEFSSNNSLLSKSRSDFSSDNSLLQKIWSIVYQ